MNLSEIRKNIDRVDGQIRELFLERMALAEQVVEAKCETGDTIYKPDREREIISHNSESVAPELRQEYQAMIKKIMEVSRKYQYGRMLELRSCFPYTFETGTPAFEPLGVLKDDEDCRVLYPDAALKETDSLGDMLKMLHDQEIAAGLALMCSEAGENESFYQMISKENIFINDCIVSNGEDSRRYLLFSEKLLVLPEHNRFLCMFHCSNKLSGLGTLLSMIADYKVNISGMHSDLVQCGPDRKYRFILELDANLARKDICSLVFQLSEEAEEFKLLGSYLCEDDHL